MGKRIILEGPDGAGKTTLAHILAFKYGLDICHCTASDPNDFDFYKQSVRKDNIVWDRHTIGELIYPKIFSREQNISVEDARIVLWDARALGAKVFVLTGNPDILQKRLLARGGEDPRILNNIANIKNEFEFYAEQFCVPVIDTLTMTLSDIFNMIKEEN